MYEALRQAGINYQGLPASFENTGQKVRTTAAVLDGRLGNCLDLSVTYAACLEQAGLHPLIWLTRDHAFAGFLVEEERLGSAASTEANLLISMVESGKAVPVELTRIGPGAQSADFTAAVQLGVSPLPHERRTSCRASSTYTWRTAPASDRCPRRTRPTRRPTRLPLRRRPRSARSTCRPGLRRTKLREHR